MAQTVSAPPTIYVPKKPSTIGLVLIWALAILTLLYFLPLAIAFSRGHKDTLGVFLVDFLLGWTIVGWVVALIWSVKSFKP